MSPFAVLRGLLAPADDPALWDLVAQKALGQAGGLFRAGGGATPRRVVVTFAAIPRRHPETHPDDAALWRQSFSRQRGEDGWSDEGASPRMRRKRGHYSLAVCMPVGTRRLAAVEVPCLWRPRFPWAPPAETEIGREVRVFLRDGSDVWHPRGVHG